MLQILNIITEAWVGCAKSLSCEANIS